MHSRDEPIALAGHVSGVEPSGAASAEAAFGAGIGPAVMAQALGALFAAGATLALLTVALPHPPQADELGLLEIVGDAYLIAGVLFWRASTASLRILALALAWGSTLIAGVAYFSAQSPSPLIFFFLWVFLYASYFFTTGQAALQIAYVGLVYGALLIVRPPANEVAAWWLVGMGTLLVAAVLVRSMRDRAELLIAKLHGAARTDPLTGVTNRRGFRELLDLELERARRAESEISVAAVDVDHFEDFNARRSQAAGDVVLRRVANVLGSSKRQLDGVARVGGKEFALTLSDTSPHEAYAIAETLRVRLAEEFAAESLPLTVSIGVATYPRHARTAASLLHAVDGALCAAKENGRDRTVLYSQAIKGTAHRAGDSRDVAHERFLAVVLDLAAAVDLRFSGSARHSETVGRYAEMMARQLGLPESRVARVGLAGMLHDLGKVGVPDAILQKPGKLTDEEFKIVRRHPELGAEILEHQSLADVRAWVGAHHERPDGRGYPRGLRGDAIPIEARILAVADAYEAMTSDRAYRASLGAPAARAELEHCAGSQFDGLVVDALLRALDREAERAVRALALH